MSFNNIIYFLFLIVYAFAVKKFMGMFFEKQRASAPISLIAYALLPLSAMIRALLADRGIWLFAISGARESEFTIISLVFVFFITLTYDASMLKRIVATLYVLLTLISIGNIVGNLIVNNLPPTNFISDHTVVSTISYTILYFVAILMHKHFKHIRKKAFDFPAFWGLALLLAIYMFSAAFHFQGLIPSLVYLYFSIFIWTVNVFLVLFLNNALSRQHEEKLKLELNKQEKELYFAQIQLMQESIRQVRSVRHDMNLHLATIKEFSSGNKATTDYINSLLEDISEGEVYSSTGNIAFDSIINFKLKTAKEDNIKLDLSLFVPPVLNIAISDIVTILGNLLDNALEAVAKIEDKMIKLEIEFSKGNLHIKIDNTFEGNVKYAKPQGEKEKRIVTQKAESGHGFGLENIQKSVMKYNGHMDISHEGNIFSVGVLLYAGDM